MTISIGAFLVVALDPAERQGLQVHLDGASSAGASWRRSPSYPACCTD
ncbi:MAG TPA: hypothetical protein VHN18_06940 [Micromonosporaceae bacterium]|nr:hypothetical protein [Micromonosporaceae bacterium]